MKHSSM